MGGSSAWSGTTLPEAITAFTAYNMSPRGSAFMNSVLKDHTIDLLMQDVAVSPTVYWGERLTQPHLSQDYLRTGGTGYIEFVNDAGWCLGVGTLFKTELEIGDTVIAMDGASDDVATFTVVEIFTDTEALFISVQNPDYGVPSHKSSGSIQIIRRPIYAPPFLFNPDVYMKGNDDNSDVHLTAMDGIITAAQTPATFAATDVMNSSSEFAATLTEAQLGLTTFANGTAAWNELHKSVAASAAGLAAAQDIINQADPAAITTTITTYAQPLVDALIAQRNADVLAVQKSYTIANGFFNTNVPDRIAEVMAKYAIQIAALEADIGMKVISTMNANAVQVIDALLKFQNGPLRDRVMAQELRLKAMEVGARVFLASDTALQQRWSLMYGAAGDAVKRDFANDMSLWGMREDLMRFNAELQQAYLGTINAGIGKGTDAAGVAKMVLGGTMIAGGAIAAAAGAAPIAPGLISGGASVMSGGGATTG